MTTATAPSPAPTGLPDSAEVAAAVTALCDLDDAARRAVTAVGALDRRRVVSEEALSVDAALRLHTRLAPGDVATILAASEVLTSMPVAAGLVASGVLSWGHVRQLAGRVGRFEIARRREVDEELAAVAETLARLDASRVTWALDDLVDRHERRATVERREERDLEVADRFVLAPRLDGTSTSYGEWTAESTALLADALTAEADAPHVPPCPGDDDRAEAEVPSRTHQLGQALMRLVTRGRHGAGAPTPPTRMTVVVDLERVTDTVAGHVRTALRGRDPVITTRTLDRLTCDTAIDAVVRDGTDLITAQRYAPDVTAATRRAVAVRDGGCRFPGCTAPVAWCDVHHVTSRSESATAGVPNGDHHLANLVLLCRRHHTVVHRRGWRQGLDTDGTYTLRRRGRIFTTLPRLRPGPARGDPPEDRGPGPDPPDLPLPF